MQKTIRCKKCYREFEVVGDYGTSKPVEQSVTCPYEDCYEPNEMIWPVESLFSVIKNPYKI